MQWGSYWIDVRDAKAPSFHTNLQVKAIIELTEMTTKAQSIGIVMPSLSMSHWLNCSNLKCYQNWPIRSSILFTHYPCNLFLPTWKVFFLDFEFGHFLYHIGPLIHAFTFPIPSRWDPSQSTNQVSYRSNLYSISYKICGGCNNSFHSCCWYYRMKWSSNLYSKRLSPDFYNCHFWHSWWSWGDSSLTIPHSLVIHWYPLWCKMKMWMYLWYSTLELNGGLICLLCGPNWAPNSMPFNLFWIIGIPSPCSYGWSTNVVATFCSSTCLTMLALMWKGTKRQSMIKCIFFSKNAQTLKSNLVVSKFIYSWSLILFVHLVWSNSGFIWCEYDCGTSSNTFTCGFAYSNGFMYFSLVSSSTLILFFSSTSQSSISS